MNVIGIAELKAKLSKYLSLVKTGEEVLITERGLPIARIVPLAGTDRLNQRILELIRKGRVRVPTKPLDIEKFLALPMPEDPNGAVLAALLEEREEGM